MAAQARRIPRSADSCSERNLLRPLGSDARQAGLRQPSRRAWISERWARRANRAEGPAAVCSPREQRPQGCRPGRLLCSAAQRSAAGLGWEHPGQQGGKGTADQHQRHHGQQRRTRPCQSGSCRRRSGDTPAPTTVHSARITPIRHSLEACCSEGPKEPANGRLGESHAGAGAPGAAGLRGAFPPPVGST